MKKLWSIFTTDMDTCIYTGSNQVERHHCLNKNKKLCEKLGYIAPLYYKIHPNGAYHDHTQEVLDIDLELKQKCQQDFEEKHGTRKEFIDKFGRNYL